jgi:hypothetical protein
MYSAYYFKGLFFLWLPGLLFRTALALPFYHDIHSPFYFKAASLFQPILS